MALFSTTNNILSLRSSILMNPRFLPINHHCNPPLRLSVPHKPTFNLSHRNPKTIVSAVTLSTEPSPRFPFSDSTKSITTLAILAGIVTKSLIHKLSAAVVTLSPQFQASLRISGPLFFAAVRDRPAGYLNTPLTVVAAGLSKWLAGTGTEVLCKGCSHQLKEKMRNAGTLRFSNEADVLKWSNTDFSFSYTASSSNIVGGLFLQSAPVQDVDQRDVFSFYLFPGKQQKTKAFKREVVFVVDVSKSMAGKPLEDVNNAISTALSKLSPGDSFNIITFSDDTSLFSTSMELATPDAVERGVEWMNKNFVVADGTNMLPPLEKAVEMLSNTRGSVPMIFFVTDGSVEDERHICNVMKKRLASGGSVSPRIHTFGLGVFCNHYFLQTLANLSRGQHESVYNTDHIEERLDKLFTRALSTVLLNIAIEPLQDLDEVEVYPSNIPDLTSSSPLMIYGRYRGKFPENVKANGLLGDFSSFSVELTVQSAKDMPLDKVFAKNVIDLLTAEAWFLEDKQLKEKISKLSIQTGVPSEYTRMIQLDNTEEASKASDTGVKKKTASNDEKQKMISRTIPLQNFGIGFGDITATRENVPPGYGEQREPDAAEKFVKAASSCCVSLCNKCCCMCCVQCCTKLNDQCVLVFTQLFTALACIACFECCTNVCCACGGED